MQGMDSSEIFFRLSVNWLGVSVGMLCSSMEEDEEGKEAWCLSRSRGGPYLLLVLGCSQNLVVVRKELKGFDQISHFMQKKQNVYVLSKFSSSSSLSCQVGVRGNFRGDFREGF